MQEPINFLAKYSLFEDLWSPKVIAEMNNYQFKLVKIKGQFIWHTHEDTDEVFIVIEGKMGIEFKERRIEINQGEMFVVEKNEFHRPFASDECKVLIIEPQHVINTGTPGSEFTYENNIWI